MKTRLSKSILSLYFFLFAVGSVIAQTGTIKGTITSGNNESVENLSVIIKGTNLGTNTDSYGNYQIKNVKVGSAILKISGIGFTTKERTINVKEGENIENISIQSSSEEISEVVINGGKTNTFTRKESQQVSRMKLSNLENPQVYSTITAELLKEQVVTNIDDALKNAPGLSQLWVTTGRGGDGSGYFSLRGFPTQVSMINGVPGLTNGSLDPANIERIEVIKGPSGTLFGSSLISYGGLINIGTKTPYEKFGGEIAYTSGSYGLNRVTADVNTPLTADKSVNFRMNTAYHTEDSFQDAGFRKSFFAAPSLSFKASEKLSFLINTEIMQSEGTNPTMLFLDRNAPLRVKNIDELGYNNKRSYTSNELSLLNPSFSLQAQMNYKISSAWTSQTILSRSTSKSKGYYSYLYETTQYYPATIAQGIILGRYFNYQNYSGLTTDIQQNFIGDFKIGKMRNRVIAGFDYFNRNQTDNGTGYVGNGSIYIGNDDQATVNAVVFSGVATPDNDSGVLSVSASDNLLAGAPVNNNRSKQEVYSSYVSNVLNIAPSLSVMASIRIDRFLNEGDVTTNADNYNQTSFSPKFGIVFQPILDKVSLFANYMDGFSNTSPGNDIAADGTSTTRTFKPEHAKQYEFGTKFNLLKDKLYTTLSYYNTEVRDQVYTVYGAAPVQTNFQDGGQINKGFEAEFVANPIKGLNITLGYSYNDSVLTAGDADFVNHRPESAGPQNLANLWASYKFYGVTLNGFGIGFGGNYASDNKIMNRTVAGTFTIPEFVRLNSSIFYNAEKYTLTIKVDNIANVETYNGWSTVHPLTPRSVSANFSYRF